MGTLKRLNDAKKKLTEAENAMPNGYENQYAGAISDKLGQLAQAASGFDYNTAADSYQNYRKQAGQNAANSAASALGTANGLAGGYGTADWATSAAKQGASASLAGADTSLAALRGNALEQWKQELSGTNSILDSLLSQQSLERSEYDGSVANAASWRDYLSSKVDTARQENSDFWNNIWTTVKGLGSAALEGYDAYKGYTQQAWENEFNQQQFDFQKQQYADSQSRTALSDQMAALEQAASYKQAGFDDAAKSVLAQYGLDETILDGWMGVSSADSARADALLQYLSLAGSGYDGGAQSYADLMGIDTTGLDTRDTLAAWQRQQSALSGGTSSKSGTSGSSSKSSTLTPTWSQLQTMAKAYQDMDESDPLWSFYHNTLAEYGWIAPSPAESLTPTQQKAVAAVNQGLIGSGKTSGTLTGGTRKDPWTTYGTVDGADMLTGASGSMSTLASPNANNYQTALSAAQQMQRQGYSADEIETRLLMENYSDEVLMKVSAALGL